MAKIEEDFIERKNPTKRDFKARPFFPVNKFLILDKKNLMEKDFILKNLCKKNGIQFGLKPGS